MPAGGKQRGPVYLDHAATTPMRPAAIEAMYPFMAECFGNPSGSHAIARRARSAMEEARDVAASFLGCDAGDTIFTSGGTESDNLAILGTPNPGTAVCSAVEHDAVLEPVRSRGGLTVRVDRDGVVDLQALADLLRELEGRVGVVSVMLVNNEVGTVMPLEEVAAVVHRWAPGAVLHTDAVQAASTMDLANHTLAADLVTIASHKLGGPKGVGVLALRRGARVDPILLGGGQERARRSGTPDVAGIVGMAAAMVEVMGSRSEEAARVRGLCDALADGIRAQVPDAIETVDRKKKSPSHLHMRFGGVEAEELVFLLDQSGVCASAGSSCSSGAAKPSHVLAAMAVPPDELRRGVRFSLGWSTTQSDIATAVGAVGEAVAKLRAGVGA